MMLSLAEKVSLLGGRVTARQVVAGEPSWFCHELLETALARERLGAWVEAGGFERASAPDVRDRLIYLGDSAIRAIVIATVAELPPPVRDYVCGEFQVLGVGWDTNGFCSLAALSPRPTIVLSGADRNPNRLAALVRHEVAHAWLEPTSPGFLEPDADPAEREAIPDPAEILAAATELGCRGRILMGRTVVEARADALAWRWERS